MLLARSLGSSRALPMLSAEDSGGGGGAESAKPDDKGEDLDKIEGLGDKGKEAIKQEREAAKAARDEAKTAKAERDALLKEKQEREAAEAKSREEEAAKKGEFEELAQKREAERDAAKADVTRITGEIDQYRAAMQSGVQASWKDLPEKVQKVGEKQYAEDDVLGRWIFLHDADTKALVAELTGKDSKNIGNPQNPRNAGTGNVDIKPLISKSAALG